MKFGAKVIFLAALAAITASPKSFAQQHNDFTEGNITLERSEMEKKGSRFQDEKSRLMEKQFSPSSDAIAFAPSSVWLAAAIKAPFSESFLHSARPIPPLAPVTITFFPLKSMFVFFLSSF